MMHSSLRTTSLGLVAGILLSLLPAAAHADPLDDLQAQIARYQAQLAQVGAETSGIDSQIGSAEARVVRLRSILNALNAQLLENNARLSDSQARLDSLVVKEARLTEQLDQTQQRLEERQAAFSSQLRVLDKVEGRSPLGLLLTSQGFAQFLQRLTGIRQVADGTRRLASQLQDDRDALAAERSELDQQRAAQAAVVATIEEERSALEQEYQIQGAATGRLDALETLLGRQHLDLVDQAAAISGQIAGAESQLASLLAFSHGRGGDVVAPEYLADAWGTYYNQRDARWGDIHLGQSPYQVWEIGCLLTSVAMVYSHFGHPAVTPGVIAANPANFTTGGLLYNSALDVPGHPARINSNPTRAWINQVLGAGGTVIVGMNIRTGGTHFVVVVGQNGPNDYWINDPWVEDAMHVSYLGSPVTGPIYDAIWYL